ncbi:LysR family transcriptional regulator [Cohnella mopanensis]|uniref:LysR family transcriptional regulator n=1 Tax=Cohnella mopanensis TaxID=2911966 RepID=UPI001EF94A61|nr:LysR family transcriptional regulator [Cohnella mopanensis]
MDIRHLQIISEIVRSNSFTKAADALHLTQPTISKTIKNLELELNAELFKRDRKQVVLTETGRTLFEYSGPILRMFDNMQAEINDLAYLKKGSIRIGMPPMAGARFFPAVIKSFQDRYPGISITLVEDGARKIEENIAEGLLDAGVVLWPVDEGIFDSFQLVKERMNVILHPEHPLASRNEIELADLALESFILFNNEFALHARIINECKEKGFDPHIVYESSQWDFIGEMVAERLGISMLPDTICRSLDPNKVRVLPLANPVIPWQLAMAWKREGYLSLAAKEWISFTRERFKT